MASTCWPRPVRLAGDQRREHAAGQHVRGAHAGEGYPGEDGLGAVAEVAAGEEPGLRRDHAFVTLDAGVRAAGTERSDRRGRRGAAARRAARRDPRPTTRAVRARTRRSRRRRHAPRPAISSRPAGVRRSATRLSLPRFHTRKPDGRPWRSRSPSGGSTFTTRAPLSASSIPATWAGRLPAPSSSTCRPSSAVVVATRADCIAGRADGRREQLNAPPRTLGRHGNRTVPLRRQACGHRRWRDGHGCGNGNAARRPRRRAGGARRPGRGVRRQPLGPRRSPRASASIDAALDAVGGPIDALFACAGIATDGVPLMQVNFIGHRHLIEAAIERGLLPPGSAIAGIASIGGLGWDRSTKLIRDFLETPDFDAATEWIANCTRARALHVLEAGADRLLRVAGAGTVAPGDPDQLHRARARR